MTANTESKPKIRLLFCETQKTCSRCREAKDVEQFSKSKRAKDGLQSSCRECNRQWYRENRARHLENARRAYKRRTGAVPDDAPLPPLASDPFVDGVHRPKTETPSYRAVHARLVARRGKASEHSCVDCGGKASHWALRVGDVWDPEVSPQGYAYTTDPDLYDPKCVRCHLQGDAPTHCKHGHEFTEENTYVRKDTGHRMCKTCQKQRYERRKSA